MTVLNYVKRCAVRTKFVKFFMMTYGDLCYTFVHDFGVKMVQNLLHFVNVALQEYKTSIWLQSVSFVHVGSQYVKIVHNILIK